MPGRSDAVTEQTTASTPAGGVSAAELAARVSGRYGSPRAAELQRWLLSERLAEVRDDGRLVATPLGRLYGTIVAQAAPEGLSPRGRIMGQ